jgi:SulP family sulfate permease
MGGPVVFPRPPLLRDLQHYDRLQWKGDLTAGLTIGVLLIPQGMAYAMIAGLPPLYGLYAALVPMVVYAIFGTSRHLNLGPAALIALLVANGVSKVAEPGSEAFIAWAISLSLGVGVLLFLLGLFRLGYLVNFLSNPVISGFTSASAVLILFSQLSSLLGMELANTQRLQSVVMSFFSYEGEWHPITAIVSLGTIGGLLLLHFWKPHWPGALLAVIGGILLAAFSSLPEQGLHILGNVPRGLPSFSAPMMDLGTWNTLLPTVLTIALMGYVQSYAIAKAVQSRDKAYRLDANQELLAQGLANIAGSFSLAFPAAGSLSRTAVAYDSGGRTGIASLIGALVVLLTVLFLTPLFRFLPVASLAAIIAVATFKLKAWKDVFRLWRTDRRDAIMLLATFATTLTMGIETGILTGVVLSLSMVIYSSSRPHYAVLGRLPNTTIYKNIARFPEAEEEEGVLIIRLDARLYFANQEYVHEALLREVAARPEIELMIVDSVSISMVDSSAVAMLQDLQRELMRLGIALRFLGLIGPVRDAFRKNAMHSAIGPDHVYMRIHDAVRQFRAEQDGIKWEGPLAVHAGETGADLAASPAAWDRLRRRHTGPHDEIMDSAKDVSTVSASASDPAPDSDSEFDSDSDSDEAVEPSGAAPSPAGPAKDGQQTDQSDHSGLSGKP